ncbi:MAG: Stk1 family PASTA domain-containing Ser/Thr kinase [Lachnospiraceae bacterium]|nr:Stk1 family PASTA domain-containing Ser/Thr kinase [Lachnospiraceae bacterium]
MINPGMMIGERYEITEKVGSGGMADVYKAKDHRLNRFVAIKILKQEFSSDGKFVSKFKAEAQSVAGISHPNIVNVYDVGEDNGLYFIVMELVEGITLKKFIEKKGKLDVGEAVGISIQIAQGMKAAHDNHIIHRDIKPQNIIISKEGKVKVTDFGIAKAATSNTITSNAMGSVHYISPEQARGGYSDEKSDIYSLGVSMYEMFSGGVPYEGDSTVTVALSHIQDEAIMLDDLDENIPHSVAMIVAKCMQKKTDMRYENAADLIHDLKRALDEPDGNYVVITLPGTKNVSGATRTITKDEMKELKKAERPEVKAPVEEVADDDTDDDVLDPKLERIIKICSAIVAIIILVVIILLIGSVRGWWDFSSGSEDDTSETTTTSAPAETEGESGKVEVPDLVGHTLQDAEKMLEDLNLNYQLKDEESDEEANTVIRQDPEAGEMLDEYEIVTVYYSAEGVTVPDVKGMTETEARTAIKEAGLTVSSTKTKNHDSIAEGNVVETDPVIGSSVEEGSSIILVLSAGPKDTTVVVPNLVGKKEDVAKQKVADLGLVVDTTKVVKAYSSTVEAGKIIDQSQVAGSEVEKGSSIYYTVSLGPEATPEPTDSPDVYYEGSFTVDTNPFVEGEDPAEIKVVLEQDGQTKTVYKGTLGFSDFPKTFTVEGWSENNGTVTVCKNDVVMGATYSVEFKAIEE